MASDFILEIDGIEGESNDKAFKNKIDIESFSWGLSNGGTSAIGGGGGAGKASFQDLHFVMQTNKASPKLAGHCSTGTHIKKAVFHVRKQGGGQQEYYTVTMEDLLVSSFQTGGSEGSPAIIDQFSLNYSKIKFEYKPQKADGSLDAAVNFGYDIKANVKL